MEIGHQIFQKNKKEIIIEKYKLAPHLRYQSLIVLGSAYLTCAVPLTFLVISNLYSLLNLILLISSGLFLGTFVGVEIDKILSKRLDMKIASIPDTEVLNLLSPLKLKKYQIKSGDLINYVNGFEFTESYIKLSVEKLSEDGESLLLKDQAGNYKEVSLEEFLSSDYQ